VRFPLRQLLALAAAIILVGIGACALFFLSQITALASTARKKKALTVVVLGIVTALIVSIVFILPAYWD
jgi:hypothetical protein